ncbi:MAG: hypothetical protein IPM56_06335 [Ignavibacteriales bacterium]|nr:MAG: hypothetical protein IPM56_06335 [Ignavibacteriales bacterium]
MNRKLRLITFFIVSLTFAFSNISCSVFQTIQNLSRLKFKLGAVNQFTFNGVNISNKNKLGDFSAMEIISITSAVANGKLPVSFTLNIDALNPNDGKGGHPRTNVSLTSFPWRLLIDDKETISGNISQPVQVPGTGETSIIPLQMNLDLASFFKDKGYESLINLALNIGGKGGSSSKLTLYAKPVVGTSVGNISYPNELKIVNYEFTN